MKQMLSIVAIIALSYAATEAKTTKFAPRLAKGHRFSLEITKARTQTGRPNMGRARGFQIVDVEILDTSKNILIEWTSRKSGVVDPDGKPIKLPAQAAAMTTVFDGVKMVFELTPEYEMIGLKNLDEIRPIMTKVFDKTLEAMNRSDEDKAQLRKVMASMLRSRKTIEAICSKQISLLLGLSQVEIDGALADKPQGTNKSEFQMPFGGGAIPAEITVTVTSFDKSANEATVTVDTKMDPEKAAEAMLAVAKTMAAKTGKPAPTKKDLPRVDIKDTCTYLVDLKTNLPLSATHTRMTSAGAGKRTDIIKIVRKPAKTSGKKKTEK